LHGRGRVTEKGRVAEQDLRLVARAEDESGDGPGAVKQRDHPQAGHHVPEPHSVGAGPQRLGTSNKSEILLGYSTLFGDAAASVQPLGDVWKTHIFALAQVLGVPDPVVAKSPTADLWPGQTDAGELGFDYPTVDPVLYWHHEGGMGRDELAASGFPPALVDSALAAYRRNRFKWRPTVVARVSASCINVDRILPRNPER
jgi:NAD+ synthase